MRGVKLLLPCCEGRAGPHTHTVRSASCDRQRDRHRDLWTLSPLLSTRGRLSVFRIRNSEGFFHPAWVSHLQAVAESELKFNFRFLFRTLVQSSASYRQPSVWEQPRHFLGEVCESRRTFWFPFHILPRSAGMSVGLVGNGSSSSRCVLQVFLG